MGSNIAIIRKMSYRISMIIGIGGGSCSGKTTIRERLMHELGDQSTGYSFDEYLHTGHPLVSGPDVDWENPELYDTKRFIKDLRVLKAGHAVTMRAISRESKALGLSELTISPTPFTIVEGFLIYHHQKSIRQFDKTVFLALSTEEMIRRKLQRTVSADPIALQDYIERRLIPGYEKYVQPQSSRAELILDGTQPVQKLVDHVLGYIMRAA